MRDLKLVGGRAIQKDGDVTIEVPTAHLDAQALATGSRTDALLISGEDPTSELRCAKCRDTEGIGIVCIWGKNEGALAFCLTCIEGHFMTKHEPLIVRLEMAD